MIKELRRLTLISSPISKNGSYVSDFPWHTAHVTGKTNTQMKFNEGFTKTVTIYCETHSVQAKGAG